MAANHLRFGYRRPDMYTTSTAAFFNVVRSFNGLEGFPVRRNPALKSCARHTTNYVAAQLANAMKFHCIFPPSSRQRTCFHAMKHLAAGASCGAPSSKASVGLAPEKPTVRCQGHFAILGQIGEVAFVIVDFEAATELSGRMRPIAYYKCRRV